MCRPSGADQGPRSAAETDSAIPVLKVIRSPGMLPMTERQSVTDRLRSMGWFTAERFSDGSRVLLRGRRMERRDYIGEIYPVVATIEHRFDREREDGLPAMQQHERYRELFIPFIESMEETAIGLHVLGDTTQGLVREWFYIREVTEFAAMAKKHPAGRLEFDIFHQADPSWALVDGAIEQIRGSGWERT